MRKRKAIGARLSDPRRSDPCRRTPGLGDQHLWQSHPARLGLARSDADGAGLRRRTDRSAGARRLFDAQQRRLHPRRRARRDLSWAFAKRFRKRVGRAARRLGRWPRGCRTSAAARSAAAAARSRPGAWKIWRWIFPCSALWSSSAPAVKSAYRWACAVPAGWSRFRRRLANRGSGE